MPVPTVISKSFQSRLSGDPCDVGLVGSAKIGTIVCKIAAILICVNMRKGLLSKFVARAARMQGTQNATIMKTTTVFDVGESFLLEIGCHAKESLGCDMKAVIAAALYPWSV